MMQKPDQIALKDSLVSLVLPEGILDYFELTQITVVDSPVQKGFTQFVKTMNIYLDELDNRAPDQMYLRPNGFTESTQVKDFTIRKRLVILHVRRRRYEDEEGKNVILSEFPIKAKGTSFSTELADFFKGGAR